MRAVLTVFAASNDVLGSPLRVGAAGMLVVDIECLLAFFVIAAAGICGFFLFEQAQSEYDAGRDCRQHLSRYRGYSAL